MGKGLSETVLNILNKSGIAMSKTTQRRHQYRTAEIHERVVADFIAQATQGKKLLASMIDDFTFVQTI